MSLLVFTILVVVGIVLGLCLASAVREVQRYWLRNTNVVRNLNRLEAIARDDLGAGVIGRNTHKALMLRLHFERNLSVFGWRRDNSLLDKDLILLLIGLQCGDDDLERCLDSAALQSSQWWIDNQLAKELAAQK